MKSTPRVGINGMGRIGRATLKILHESPHLELVGVNDIASIEDIAYLLRHDSVYGRYAHTVEVEDDALRIGQSRYLYLSESDPADLSWGELDVDLVFECTGLFDRTEDLQKHLDGGASHVILSQPAKDPDVPFVVFGANKPAGDAPIISCASCTTNCITPVMEVLERRVGVAKAIMTTVHAYTSSQALVDAPAGKRRRGRAAAVNLVPTSTGAAKATARVLPGFEGLFDGVAVRAPVPVGSVSDIVASLSREASVEEINEIFREESQTERYDGVLGVTEEPWVSSDVIRDPRASIVDLGMTQVVDGDLLKIMSWYDNEWGYCSQMVRTAQALLSGRESSTKSG